MEYAVSIRITFPENLTEILRKEKERFVTEYGSSYKSEPHITLYLDRYTEKGFPQLIRDLKELDIQPFTISLLEPRIISKSDGRRNLYVLDMSNKKDLQKLHDKVSEIAIRYQSPLIREKIRRQLEQQGIHTDGKREDLPAKADLFDPHITLGEVKAEGPQPDLAQVQENLQQLAGHKILVESLTVFFDGKKDGDEKFKLIEKIAIPF